jgi:hypothetical protein
MQGLIITEANSLLDRPIMYADGELKENQKVIPAQMDKIYLKIEAPNQNVFHTNINLQYNFRPPYIKNLYQAMSHMYPVLKGNMAYGGSVNSEVTKHLLLEFNCLGIKGTQDLVLVLTSAID